MSDQDWIGYTGMLLIITLGLTVLPVFLFQKVISYYGIPIYIFPAVLTLIWAIVVFVKSFDGSLHFRQNVKEMPEN